MHITGYQPGAGLVTDAVITHHSGDRGNHTHRVALTNHSDHLSHYLQSPHFGNNSTLALSYHPKFQSPPNIINI